MSITLDELKSKYEWYRNSLENGYGTGMVKIDGCWVLNNFLLRDEQILDKIKNLAVRDDDVFITSFPKSGITWVNEIVYLIMNNADTEKAKSTKQEDRVPYIEYPFPGIDALGDIPSPRLLKTHFPFDFIPSQIAEKKAKIIYVFRNGSDVAVSLYYFVQFMNIIGFQGTFEEFFQDFIEGKVMYGPWWSHIANAWNRRSQHNVLFVSYEGLIADYSNEIRRITKFLGKDLTEAQFTTIEDHCRFENMKSNPSANFSHLVEKNIMHKSRSDDGLIRKGEVGNWKSYFSPQMKEKMDDIVKEKLEPLGLCYKEDAQRWEFVEDTKTS